MNAAISTLVAIVAVLVVVGAALFGINAILGQWAILAWLAIGWCVFIGVAQKINS